MDGLACHARAHLPATVAMTAALASSVDTVDLPAEPGSRPVLSDLHRAGLANELGKGASSREVVNLRIR